MPLDLRSLVTGPLARVLDGAARELAAEVVDARGPVTRTELAAVADRLEHVRTALAAVRADAEALRQAVDGFSAGEGVGEALGIGDPAQAVEAAAARRVETSRRLGRLLGALEVTAEQLRELEPAAGPHRP